MRTGLYNTTKYIFEPVREVKNRALGAVVARSAVMRGRGQLLLRRHLLLLLMLLLMLLLVRSGLLLHWGLARLV